MKSLFNPDSPLMKLLSKAADLMLLNLLWMICCLPVFTFGASTSAMYHVVLKMATEEEPGILKTFWQGFRGNFNQATRVFLILLIPLVLVVADVLILASGAYEGDLIMTMICALPAAAFAMIYSYVFPLTAKFENTAAATVKNAMLLCVGNFPLALLVTGINLIPVIWMIAEPVSFTRNFIWFLLGGFAWIAYANGKLLHKFFELLIQQKAEEAESHSDTPVQQETDIRIEDMSV